MVEDVKKLQLLTDPGVHFKLVSYCHNTRLSHLSRTLPPTTMANPACGIQTVDYAVVNEVLAKGTDNRSALWGRAAMNWHRMTAQLPHHEGGMGLTPQRASGIAAFYSASSTFVGWLARRPHRLQWLRQGELADPGTWLTGPLLELTHTHKTLLQDYKCVEAAPAANAGVADADNGAQRAASPLSLPPLNLLHKQHQLSEEEIGAGCVLPLQRRVTGQIMSHWGPHATAKAEPPSARCQHLRMLHRTHTCIATSSTDDGEPGHSILQHDMPDQEDPDCPEAKKRRLKHAGAAHMSCLAHEPVKKEEWEAWFCQFLGEPIPALEKLARARSVCACGRHIIDAYGDHVHACKQHTGSRKAAHETILDAIEAICRKAGITTERRNIPSVQKRRNKRGRGDLVLKNVNLGGHRHLVLDVAVNHEFGGDNLADVSRNGALRDAQPARILENTARTKVARYRAGYAEIRHAFLPCVISTSGRLHGEFLRLLYIIAHRRTTRWFQRHSNDEPSEDAFKFRRGQYFWHTRAAIGQAAARAVAQRVHVAEHTLRRHRVPSNVQDDLAYPATVH